MLILASQNLRTLVLGSLLLSCLLCSSARAQDRLASLVGDGSVILQSPEGELLVSINPERPLVPASVLKIPLAQAALEMLGEDFRFETLFYSNSEGDLLIRGLGDPFLVTEEIALIASTLAELRPDQIRRIVVDDSAFAAELDLPVESGTDQPYGARNSALAVNFNTVNLGWSATGELVSGEAQTPLTALAAQLGNSLSPGAAQRINLGDDPLAGLQQAQQLFLHFLGQAGVQVRDSSFYREPLNEDWILVYRHSSSRSLREILDGMLRYSNNFIANQLFLTLGAQVNGYPATAEAGREVLQNQLASLYGSGFGSDPQRLLVLEGSGLSRAQRSSARAMLRILEVFEPYAELLPESNGVLRKSGTLTGVYNFAGYIHGSQGLYPFVILTNQSVNNRAEILRLLQEEVAR